MILIKKGGIYRNVPECKLPEYKDKGYAPVDGKSSTPAKSGKKDAGTKTGG